MVAVVPCGAAKLSHAAPARDLYTSKHFQLALAAAEAEAAAYDGPAEVLILSGKHGLLSLDTMVEPYDVRMGDPGSVSVDTITAQARARGWDDLAERAPDVYGFLPNRYFEALDAALRPLFVWATQVYEATSGLGDQRHVCKVVTAA